MLQYIKLSLDKLYDPTRLRSNFNFFYQTFSLISTIHATCEYNVGIIYPS